MKQLLIYERPMALDRVRHRHLRVPASLNGFAFARDINSVPIVVGEFASAVRDYPLVFAGATPDVWMPTALLGLDRNDNLFVDANGVWAERLYVPAFLRRYPFVVAGGADAAADFTVCIDEAFLSHEGEQLFDSDGTDTPLLTKALGFLAEYQNEVHKTRFFVQELVEHQLLVSKTVKIERAGHGPRSLSGFSIVDESRLRKLSGKVLKKLEHGGSLALIYAHLLSLNNLQRLSLRMDSRTH